MSLQTSEVVEQTRPFLEQKVSHQLRYESISRFNTRLKDDLLKMEELTRQIIKQVTSPITTKTKLN